jgi:hypothetical protein
MSKREELTFEDIINILRDKDAVVLLKDDLSVVIPIWLGNDIADKLQQQEKQIHAMRNCTNCNRKFCLTEADSMGYRDLVKEARLHHECQSNDLKGWVCKFNIALGGVLC